MPKTVVNVVNENNSNAAKASACWLRKPNHKVLGHVSKQKSASITLKSLIMLMNKANPKTESNVWDDGSEDVNPFGERTPGFYNDHYDNPLLTTEIESELIIWDTGDEEEEYHFVNKYPSFQEEHIMLMEEESCPVYDTDNEEEESMPIIITTPWGYKLGMENSLVTFCPETVTGANLFNNNINISKARMKERLMRDLEISLLYPLLCNIGGTSSGISISFSM
nr:hypothetical protein [Tanacetum cinerariifolium]